MGEEIYSPVKPSKTAHYEIRSASYLVRTWGSESARPMVLLHGMRDTSATFQFLVDALKGNWRIIAPDWRGHGQTKSAGHRYWFHDYLADLDALLELLVPDQVVDLIGHSLGGNVASAYAGLRAAKVRHIVSLDAFGILEQSDSKFADLLADWLPSARRKVAPPRYRSVEAMADKLCSSNQRLGRDKALYLAVNSSRRLSGDAFTWQFEADYRRSMPTFHTLDEWIACWRRITAPILWIAAADSMPGTVASNPESFAAVRAHIAPESVIRLPDTGHNVHHDAPVQLAGIIEQFLDGESLVGEPRLS